MRGQGHYKEAGAFGLRPEGGWARAFYSASSPIRWAFWRLARKFSGSWNATACESLPRFHATNSASACEMGFESLLSPTPTPEGRNRACDLATPNFAEFFFFFHALR